MFRFLYMFGPGILSWLVRSKCLKSEEDKNILYIVMEIIAFSFVNMAVTIAVFKFMGRITFVTLSNGTLDVHYGATAFLAAMFLAVVIGIFSFRAEKKMKKD